MGRRSNSSRPRMGAEPSEQDLIRMIQQSEAQLTVALQVGVGDELQILAEGFGEMCSQVEGSSVRIPLLECGIRDWQHLVTSQRIIAQLQRPQPRSGSDEDGLKAETKVQQDRTHREANYLALALSREAEDQLWKFVNDLRLRLQSAGVLSRPLLTAGQPILVRLTASTSRRSQQSNRNSNHWAGNLKWDRIVVLSTNAERATDSITQTQALDHRIRPDQEQTRYPELETMLRSWIKDNSDTRKPIVIILRGIPGSGKSTLGREARELCAKLDAECTICSADFFFETPRGYVFDVKGLGRAHDMCKDNFTKAILSSLRRGDSASKKPWVVIVDNTNTQLWEYEPYQTIAAKYNCSTYLLEMTCADAGTAYRMGERNSHGVPPSKVVSMFQRWEHDPSAHSFTPQFGDSLLTANPVTDNNIGGKLVYVGLFFNKVARTKLLSKISPIHQNVVADHVTVFYKPPRQFMRTIDVGDEVIIRCIEIVQDEKGQAIRVELLETSSQPRIRNRVPHITISTAAGISSSYSNELLESPSAERIAVADMDLAAKVGYAMIVQNQRVITTRSPFAFSDLECSAANYDRSTTAVSVVHLDEAGILRLVQNEASDACITQIGGRLSVRKVLELVSSSYSTHNILILQSDESTKDVPTTAMLAHVEKLLSVPGVDGSVFSNVVRAQGSTVHNALTEVLQSDASIAAQRITIFTTSDVSFWANLHAQSVIGISTSCAQSSTSDAIQLQQQPRSLIKVMDTLGLTPQERTLHDVLRVCRKLNSATNLVLGGGVKPVYRTDSTVLGLPASCVDASVVMPEAIPSAELHRLQGLVVAHLTKSGVHCYDSSQPGKFFVSFCSLARSSGNIRVNMVCNDTGNADLHRVKLCNDLRERVGSICPDESVYAMLVALFAGLLRSSFVRAPITSTFVSLATEHIICECLHELENPQALSPDDIISILSQLLHNSTSWTEPKWEELLAPVYRALPDMTVKISPMQLVVAIRSLLEVIDKLIGDEEANAATVEVALRNLLIRNAGITRSTMVRANADLPAETPLGATTLRSFALCDALQAVASLSEVNPAQELFCCNVSIVANRINVIAGSVELLHRVQHAFNERNSESQTPELHVAFRLADTEVEI